MCRAASRPARWTSSRANENGGSDLQFRLHSRGEGWPPRDLVEKSREAGPTPAPGPHLLAPRDVFQRGAEHDLRRGDRPPIVAFSERGVEPLAGAPGPPGVERGDPRSLLSQDRFAVPHRG